MAVPDDDAWIAAGLGGAFGAVTRFVPRGYAAYARVLHPARDETHARVRWSDVARSTGRQAHATMQWHAIAGSWRGGEPSLGVLAADLFTALCDCLAAHTTSVDDCRLCVWDGHGWLGERAAAPALGPARLVLPDRTYLCAAGPLESAQTIGWWLTPEHLVPESPNLLWPADRAWLVASEIDLDSTLVGGSAALIEAVLADPRLEGWRVEEDDSLAFDGDWINQVGPS